MSSEVIQAFLDSDYSDAIDIVEHLDNDQRLALSLALERFSEALDETRRERGVA